MKAKVVMVQGTGSSVGKSMLVAALCRIFRQEGYSVAPFKAQNMALNSFATLDGAEIGRAQAAQAEAAGVLPSVDMNPVLLKPEVDYRSQLVVMGQPVGTLESPEFGDRKELLWDVVTSALDRLRSEFEVVVIEGAGSPAEINLRQGDIVNMEVALYASSPVLLVGDIDRGGVFASLWGTVSLLDPRERQLVKGTVINKFRGDVSLLTPGLTRLEELTGAPVLGVVPFFRDIYLSEEDSPASGNVAGLGTGEALLDIAVVALPHIANFDDFDPLRREPGVEVRYVRSAVEMGTPDLIILPGTKTTVADLQHIRENGIADLLVSHARAGVAIVGVCGGYQMLGQSIADPDGVESGQAVTSGLGLLPVDTTFAAEKQTHQVSGWVASGIGMLEGSEDVPLEGYEIHMGSSQIVQDSAVRIPFQLSYRSGRAVKAGDGHIGVDGWTLGTYIHGLFQNTELRRNILHRLAERKGVSLPVGDSAFSQSCEYDKLAYLIRECLDMRLLRRIVGLG